MEHLTNREKEVLKYVVNGLSNIEIAKKAFITEHTVKAHISSIIRKFGVKTRIDIAVLAIIEGLVKVEDVKIQHVTRNY
jgi:DNA-binding CsgD family transcriptional regulator